MLEYKLFSNNYCKHSKTVIKIKLANIKASTVHSLKLKNSDSAMLQFIWATKQILTPEIIIQTFDYNAYENKHLNNQKGTTESILCSLGINEYKWTVIILGFLFVDSDVIKYITNISNKLYVWLTTYLKASSHNLPLHTYIQIVTSSREIQYKIDEINIHCQLVKIWNYIVVGARKSSWDKGCQILWAKISQTHVQNNFKKAKL